MANSDLPPSSIEIDPLEAQVLYAGNLADDDFLWIVRCSAKEYHRLIETPVAWVAALAGLPGWRYFGSDQPAPAAVLSKSFAMVVQEAKVPDPDGWLLVQGISETNELTVYASREAALRSVLAQPAGVAEGLGITTNVADGISGETLLSASDDPFGPFWDEVASDPNNPPTLKKKFPVTIVQPLGRFYTHFEITSPGETPAEQAARNASFLLAAVTDPDGYAKMLSSLDQVTLYAQDRGVVEGKPIEILPAPGITVVYAAADTPGTTVDETTSTTCNMATGQTDPPTAPTTGTPDGTTVKVYKATSTP